MLLIALQKRSNVKEKAEIQTRLHDRHHVSPGLGDIALHSTCCSTFVPPKAGARGIQVVNSAQTTDCHFRNEDDNRW